MNFCNYDVTKYGRCTTNDLLFEMLYDYNFEMIFWKYFHSQKRLWWPSFWNYFLFELGSAQSANWFLCHSLWNDKWLSFRNEQSIPVFVLKCLMTVILKWGRQKFSSTKLFSSGKFEIFYWRKSAINNNFRTQIFTQCQCPYTCVEIQFFMKGGICNVRF